MDFAGCIDEAIRTGRIKPDRGQEIKEAYKEAYKQAKLDPAISDRAADDMAAKQAVTTMTAKTKKSKWAKVHQIRVAAEISSNPLLHADPKRFMEIFWPRLDDSAARIVKETMAVGSDFFEKFAPKKLGLVRPVKELEGVVRASFDEKVSAESRAMFETTAKMNKFLRNRANANGAFLHENPNRRLPQAHSRERLRDYELKNFKGKPAEARKHWVDYHIANLDWELMLYDGAEIPVGKRAEILGHTYDSIYTDGNIRITPGYKRVAALADRMSRERFLYYKNADAWLEANKRWGSGDLYHQLVGSIDRMSRSIAMLEHLGPDPTEMLNYLRALVQRRAAEIQLDVGAKSKMQSAVNLELSRSDDAYAYFSGMVNNGSDSPLSQGLATFQTLVNAGILAKAATISQMGDLFNAHMAFKLHGIPFTGYIQRYFSDLMALPRAEARKQAMADFYGMESFLRPALAMERYFGPMQGKRWAQGISDFSFRLSGMTPWAQAGKQAPLAVMWHFFAENAGKEFGRLPESMRGIMTHYGITKADWDLFRQTPAVDDFHGLKVIKPPNIAQVAGDAVIKQRVGDKFFDFSLGFAKWAAPEAGTREMVMLGRGLDQSREYGMVMRAVSAIKTFTLLQFTRYLYEGMAQAPSKGAALRWVGRWALMLTLGGAFITQAKQIAIYGRDPMNMNPLTPEGRIFWMQAALNGGSMGFAGDWIFGALGHYQQSSAAEILAGPLPAFFDDLRKVTWDDTVIAAIQGKKSKFWKDLNSFNSRYNPAIPWYVRLAFQRAFSDEALRYSDPEAYARMLQNESRRNTELNQGSWYGPGQQPRIPNLGGAIGQVQR